MENNNKPNEGKTITIRLSHLIIAIILLVVVLAGILYVYMKENSNNAIKDVTQDDENYQSNEVINDKIEIKNKVKQTYYMDANSIDSGEIVKVYEDNTVTVQISENAHLAFDKELTASIEANKEYEITGLDYNVVDVDFLNSVEGGAYVGSYIFLYGENNELYLVDMHKGISTGTFKAVKIEIDNREGKPQCKEMDINEEISTVIVVVYDQNGQAYKISRDGTLEKYLTQAITDAQAKEYIEEFFRKEVYDDAPDGIKYQVIDIRADGMSDEYYYYEVDLYIIDGESTIYTTWGFELLNSNGNIVRRNIVKT